MRPVHIDRLSVVLIAAPLVVWAGCLTVLWGWAFDSSGASMLISLAAMMFAVRATIPLPGRAARATQRLLVWMKLQDVLAMELAVASARRTGRREARAMVRLLAAATIFAVGCSFISTLAIFAGSAAAEALGRQYLWAPLAWAALKLLVQFAGMIPVALGISVAFLAAATVRRGSGRDVYASVCRDWLWGIAAGLAAFGVLWHAGLNIPAVVLTAAVVLLVLAAVLYQRPGVAIRPRRLARLIETSPQRRHRLTGLAGAAAAMLGLLLQSRLLGDVVGLGMGARACWVGLSIVLLTGFLRSADRKSRPPGQAQLTGAIIGVTAGLMMQSALFVASLYAFAVGSGVLGGICIAAAVAAQLPLAALAAIIISRHRRVFARAGGSVRMYVADASAGAGLGVLGYLVVGAVPEGLVVLPALGLLALAGGLIGGIALRRRIVGQLKWAAYGAVLMCAVSVAVLVSIQQGRLAVGSATPGMWLSSISTEGPGLLRREAGCLPFPSAWRSDGVTEAQRRIMAAHKGWWWVVTSSHMDWPEPVPWGVHVIGSAPDPTAVPPGAWGDLLDPGSDRDFLQAAQTGRELFDGILLSPLPADHPQAWRCYNERTLRRCIWRVHAGGIILLRTQAGHGDLAEALAVAKTFYRTVGSGWAVVRLQDGRLDMLLAGPQAGKKAPGVLRPEQSAGVFVVPLQRLWPAWLNVRPIRLVSPPPSLFRQRLSPARLHYWLQCARKN